MCCVSGCGDCEMFSRTDTAAEQRIQGLFAAVWRAALSVHSPASRCLHECTAHRSSGALSHQLQVLRRSLEIHECVGDKY